MKGYKLMAVALLALVLLGFSGIAHVQAYQSTVKDSEDNTFGFDEIEINGNPYTNGAKIGVYRGNTITINTNLFTGDFSGDVEIEAEVTGDGVEDDIEDEIEKFDVDSYMNYQNSLTLELPDDLDVLENYTLTIFAEGNDTTTATFTYDLDVQMSNTLEVYDLVISPGLDIEAGQTIAANIGVKNLGTDEQEDVRVYMKVPALGLSTMTTLFDLFSESDYDADDDDNYKVHRALELQIPSNVEAGNYELVFEVVYEDGDEVVTETRTLVVNGGSVTTDDVVISVDVTSQDIVQGRGAVYKILFANVGSNTAAYTIELSDVSAWGTVRADPLTLTVSPDNNGEAYIFVSTLEGAQLGANTFTVKVLSGDSVVKEFDLVANVIESSSLSGWDEVRLGLEIGFAVLLVILVVLGIVLVAKRLGKGEDGEEPLIEEGQSYY
jgi:uncharacterized membrane protein